MIKTGMTKIDKEIEKLRTKLEKMNSLQERIDEQADQIRKALEGERFNICGFRLPGKNIYEIFSELEIEYVFCLPKFGFMLQNPDLKFVFSRRFSPSIDNPRSFCCISRLAK